MPLGECPKVDPAPDPARVHRVRPAAPGQGRLRAGDVHQHRRRPDPERVRGQAQSGGEAGRRRREGRREDRGAAGYSEVAAEATRQRGTAARVLPVRQLLADDRAQVRAHERPVGGQPAVRQPARVRSGPRARAAEGAVRLPVPEPERRADPDPAQAEPDRRPAPPRARPDQANGQRPRLQAESRREVRRDRHPGRRRRPGVRRAAVDLRPARRRAARDGGDPGGRVPHAHAPSAAGARLGRRGGDLRLHIARRLRADDGVDRRAAGPDRACGRLRDPAAGAL